MKIKADIVINVNNNTKEKLLIATNKADVMGRKEIAVYGGKIPPKAINPTKLTGKSFCVLLNQFRFVQLFVIMLRVI